MKKKRKSNRHVQLQPPRNFIPAVPQEQQTLDAFLRAQTEIQAVQIKVTKPKKQEQRDER